MEIRKNISLIVGVSIPIIMVILVALSIYVPRYFAPKPTYDFIYLSGYGYYGQYNYYVEQGRLRRVENPPANDGVAKPLPYGNVIDQKVFYHDTVANQSREISFEEAEKHDLDSNIKSPDGFEIVYGSSGLDPFGGSDYNNRYLRGHSTSEKLNLNYNGNYYDFRFMGWIKK